VRQLQIGNLDCTIALWQSYAATMTKIDEVVKKKSHINRTDGTGTEDGTYLSFGFMLGLKAARDGISSDALNDLVRKPHSSFDGRTKPASC